MTHRLIEIIVSTDKFSELSEFIEKTGIDEHWFINYQTGRSGIRVLIESVKTEDFLDKLERKFNSDEHFFAFLLPVEAMLPKKEKEDPDGSKKEKLSSNHSRFVRISRAELYDDMMEHVSISYNFVLLLIVSSIVAGIGILQNDLAVTIGAMVIAPLIGPQISLAFATLIGDKKLIESSIWKGIAGTAIALSISVIWGLIDPVAGDLTIQKGINFSIIALALASGIAGALAIIRGTSLALVGVMVAVALLPPLIKTGLFIGTGDLTSALQIAIVYVVNIICINLAAVITFWLVGIRPNFWWEAKKARLKTRNAIITWTMALLVLAAVIYFMYYY